MILMQMPVPLYHHRTLSECTDSAPPHEPITELFLLFCFLCQQFVRIVHGVIMFTGAIHAHERACVCGRGGLGCGLKKEGRHWVDEVGSRTRVTICENKSERISHNQIYYLFFLKSAVSGSGRQSLLFFTNKVGRKIKVK